MSDKCEGVQDCKCECYKDPHDLVDFDPTAIGAYKGLTARIPNSLYGHGELIWRTHRDRRGRDQVFCGSCGHDQASKATKKGGYYIVNEQ